jgi:hypothetical protein
MTIGVHRVGYRLVAVGVLAAEVQQLPPLCLQLRPISVPRRISPLRRDAYSRLGAAVERIERPPPGR